MASLHTVQHRGCILKRTPHNFHRFSAPTCSCLLVVLFGVDKRIPQDSLIPLCWPSWTVVFISEIILGLIDFILAHPLSLCLCYVVCAVCEFGGTRIFFRIDWLHRAIPVKFWVCVMLCVCVCVFVIFLHQNLCQGSLTSPWHAPCVVCLWLLFVFVLTRNYFRVHRLHRGTHPGGLWGRDLLGCWQVFQLCITIAHTLSWRGNCLKNSKKWFWKPTPPM